MFAKDAGLQSRRNVLAPLPGERHYRQRSCGQVRLPLPAPIEARAEQRLLDDCPYAFYFKCVSFQFKNGVLTVRGRVPTFYLKQIVQSRLRDLEGVAQIDNQVDVVSATGVSSEPRIDPSE